MNYCKRIEIKGIVQGVGFRPFVYNLAKKHNLSGYILNNRSGVSIEIEGEKELVDSFLERVKNNPPPLAVIFEFISNEIEPVGYNDFEIRKSDDKEEKFVPISPEIATCDDCLKELFDPDDRRYRYPFINCTNCGPRFTIVKDVPYDRKFTTMNPFIMCDKCQGEYDDPANRRFHAQPNACIECGPGLTLLDSKGTKIDVPDIITETCRLLKDGKIIAIKGLGGFHLACDALNNEAVGMLRVRKYREYKPFALMVENIETAKKFCYVNDEEETLLNGTIRPIVLLRKKENNYISKDVSPNQKYHGIMLPYTPLHHVIVSESGLALVMTSGNISSEPIVYHDDEGLNRLKNIADYYVLNNREIHIRIDDSVSRIWHGREVILRRSRGYIPFPIVTPFEFNEQILACGAELKNTFCLTRKNLVFMSHHIGDLENLETLASFEEGIEHFKKIFNIEPAYIAYDLHPDYLSTRYALSVEDIPLIGVQHHHAHIVSCMGDNGIDGEVIGVSFDGTGYGADGKIWGGEFFTCTKSEFNRMGHLEYLPLPGGEKAIKEPWRMAACYLYKIFGEDMNELDIDFVKDLDKKKWNLIKTIIDRNINSPMTSSAGRLFDAVSALIGIRKEVYYQGQAAIELEMIAGNEDNGIYNYDFIDNGGISVVLLESMIKEIISDLTSGINKSIISSKFHNSIANIIFNMCIKIKKDTGINRVALSGGVFQNTLLLDKTYNLLDNKGFDIYTHHRVPPNDGGLSLGQAISADERIKKGMI